MNTPNSSNDWLDELLGHDFFGDSYTGDHRITLAEAKATITAKIREAEHTARMNLLDYFDQIPKNEYMDWKGLIASCKRLLEEELNPPKSSTNINTVETNAIRKELEEG